MSFLAYLLLFAFLGVLATLALLVKVLQDQTRHHAQLKQAFESNLSLFEQRLQHYYATQQKEWVGTVERLHHTLHEISLNNLRTLQDGLQTFANEQNQRQHHHIRLLQKTLQDSVYNLDKQLKDTLQVTTQSLNERFHQLGEITERHLGQISQRVETRLSEGFEKTTATFTDIVKRLALIDDAQKKITELSSNVVSLQEILSDKSARGAFGEVQLSALIRNVMPEQHYAFQHVLSNGARVDCLLFLPSPTGNVAIDAKFPLENYRTYHDHTLSAAERQQAKQQFKRDVLKHIQDISEKYVIADETAEGAILFLPAESIFADIHSHFPEIIEKAHQSKVWITSPTTMMAIITTARAVLKDAATRKQVHIIQEHLRYLAKDFTRFEQRMDNLSKHIEQVHQDATQVHTSAKKIAGRFNRIEQVEIPLDEFTEIVLEKTPQQPPLPQQDSIQKL